jgi:hypothetical protein
MTKAQAKAETAWRFRPGIVQERFGEAALVLLGDTDRLLTLNRAGGEVLAAVMRHVRGDGFGLADLARILSGRYELSATEARAESRSLLRDWESHGVVLRHAEG